ncbi:GNAT family N-acetyltransferase [Streptomyces sp. NPDC000941]
MNHEAVLSLFDRQMRQDARADDPEGRVERIGDVVRQIGAGNDDWNGVVWSDLDEVTADAAITAQVQYFASLGREFEWKLYGHDQPGNLAGRLRAAGFSPEPEETLMVAEIDDLPIGVELPEGVHVQSVTDPSGVDLAVDVHEQAFGTSAVQLRHRMLSQLAGRPETLSMVVAMAGDLPVCAARMELHPGTAFASLWGGGTVPAWRGLGIYRALVAHRARIAAELGYRYLQVDASSQSRPILQRLGFAVLSTTTPHVYRP